MFLVDQTIDQDIDFLFKHLISDKNDFLSTFSLEQFIKKYSNGIEKLKEYKIPMGPHSQNLVSYACLSYQPSLLTKLLDLGFDVNAPISSPDPFADGATPLTVACELNLINIAKILIEHGADVLKTSKGNLSVLMKTRSLEMFNLIKEKAEKKNCWDALLSLKDSNNQSVYGWAAYNGVAQVAGAFLNQKSFNQDELTVMLHAARRAYWDFPDSREEFNAQITQIKKAYKPHRVLKYPQDAALVSAARAYEILYGEKLAKDVPHSKELAVKKAIAQAYSLFHSPTRCVGYLDLINTKFKQFYKDHHDGKDFPSLDPLTYQFKVLNGTYYPFPTADYKKLDKDSALQKFIISILSAEPFNVAAESSKWVGLIPEPIAIEMFGRGDCVYESRLGPGNYHSKHAHVLQNLVMALAMEGNQDFSHDIDTKYIENGETKHITLKDILFGLVNLRNYQNQDTLQVSVRDQRNFDEFSFSDPNRFISFIMYYGKKYHLDALSDYLIDTNCSGFLGMEEGFKQSHPGLNLTRDEFIKQCEDLNSNSFEMSKSLYNYVMEYEKKRYEEKGKPNFSRFFSSHNFLAIPKTYTVDPTQTIGNNRF